MQRILVSVSAPLMGAGRHVRVDRPQPLRAPVGMHRAGVSPVCRWPRSLTDGVHTRVGSLRPAGRGMPGARRLISNPKGGADVSFGNQGRSPRSIPRSRFGKLVFALAVAVTAAVIAAPQALASRPGDGGSSACVFQTFKPSSTYQSCVKDEQVLLNDLFVRKIRGPDRQLTTDGLYGPNTSKDVSAFNLAWIPTGNFGDVTVRSFYPDSPGTWDALCYAIHHYGLSGGSTYYRAAGCQLIQP
jgi:hypothetical protein